MGKQLRRIQYLFRRESEEAALAEEMAFHREMLAREHGGDRGAASRAMGNTTLAREEARGVWLVPWLESFWQDLVYGVRGMWKQKGFTAVAVAALAIAIGLNSGMFTVFNALALRPWPVKDPGRVVNVARLIHKGPEAGGMSGFGVMEWRYISEHTKAFRGLILSRNDERVEIGGQPQRLSWVSANYFSVLGNEMARGRGFLPEEDVPQAPQAVAVLNYLTWQNRYAGDPAIVGKTVRMDEIPFTIVGVAAEGFHGTDSNRADLWAPLSARRVLRPHDADVLPFLTNLNHCCSSMAGRLAPGYTREQGAAEVELLVSQVQGKREWDEGISIVATGTAMLQARSRRGKQPIIPALAAMFLAMTLVLLLACANVGNLLLARAAARSSEIAVRLSLGGSRLRLIRQLMVESLALAGLAAVAGLALAWDAPTAILAQIAPENAIAMNPDLLVCGYTAGLAALACLVFGLAPALHGTRGQIAGALKSQSRTGAARLPLRSVLLAAQVAISVVLLAAAGLLLRGLQRAQHQDPGFRMDGISIVRLELPAAAYDGKRSQTFTAELQDALSHGEGLAATAVASDAPMANSRSWTTARRAGEPENSGRMIQMHQVSAAYFDVLGIPIAAGRNFTRDDTSRRAVLLNQTAARRFFGEENAVGKAIASGDKTWDVVGVVKDAYTTDLSTIPPMLYWPVTGAFGVPQLLVADGGNAAVRERIASIVVQLEPKARLAFIPLAENLQSQLEPARIAAGVAGALGLLALGLASIGMSGVFAYAVRQRRREIGVRMALGARPIQVVRLVVASHLRALAWGLVAGLGGAFAVTRLLKSIMHGVTAFDPIAYAGVLALLAVAAAAASAVPARRAARVDPVTALRWE
jgi:predicted permease